MFKSANSRIFLSLLFTLILSGCGHREEATPTPLAEETPTPEIIQPVPMLEEPVQRPVQQYQYNYQPPSPPLTFNGYDCTYDCSGHEAGYEWAEEHGIDDPDECGGNSNSFIEGCQSYAEEQQQQSSDEGGSEY